MGLKKHPLIADTRGSSVRLLKWGCYLSLYILIFGLLALLRERVFIPLDVPGIVSQGVIGIVPQDIVGILIVIIGAIIGLTLLVGSALIRIAPDYVYETVWRVRNKPGKTALVGLSIMFLSPLVSLLIPIISTLILNIIFMVSYIITAIMIGLFLGRLINFNGLRPALVSGSLFAPILIFVPPFFFLFILGYGAIFLGFIEDDQKIRGAQEQWTTSQNNDQTSSGQINIGELVKNNLNRLKSIFVKILHVLYKVLDGLSPVFRWSVKGLRVFFTKLRWAVNYVIFLRP